MFFDLFIFNSDKLKEQSLNDLSLEVRERYGVEISKQGLDKRFTDNAVDFLKQALDKLLQRQLFQYVSLGKMKHFNRVLIKDSVCFELPAQLAKDYPGSGGSASGAMMRIQFEYDLLCGRINDLSLHAFNEQDQKDAVATIELTKENDLIIRDLGYVNLTALQKIIKQKGLFLNRLDPSVYSYELHGEHYEKLDFSKIYNYMKKNKLYALEKEVYLGQKAKLKVRLILYLLPEQETAERLRKANKNCKKKGRKALSKEYKARMALNLFVTNTTQEQISIEKIWAFYRMRWQIELVFKVWKSICSIHKIKKVKKARLECYIYARLIFIILGWQILWRIAEVMFHREKQILSFYKAFKTLLNKSLSRLQIAIFEGKNEMYNFIYEFYQISKDHHFLEKKGKEQTPREVLLALLI